MSYDEHLHGIRLEVLDSIKEVLPVGETMTCMDMDDLQCALGCSHLEARQFKRAIGSLIHNQQYGRHVRVEHPLDDPGESPDRLVKLVRLH